ncbi:hypothetical protein OY671_012060 [Metschnikowia pulcherrima]|nr:hypothetical protein OY671_012060 [Metschnikowia pulcherrima]
MSGDMSAEIARQVGRKAPKVRSPRGPLYPSAWANEALCRSTGRSDPFSTLDSSRMSRYRMFFSSAKAEAELGYSARPWQGAIGDAIAWFRQAGMIR